MDFNLLLLNGIHWLVTFKWSILGWIIAHKKQPFTNFLQHPEWKWFFIHKNLGWRDRIWDLVGTFSFWIKTKMGLVFYSDVFVPLGRSIFFQKTSPTTGCLNKWWVGFLHLYFLVMLTCCFLGSTWRHLGGLVSSFRPKIHRFVRCFRRLAPDPVINGVIAPINGRK